MAGLLHDNVLGNAALADMVFVPYASPGSKTEELCKEIIGWGKALYTFDSKYTAGLMEMRAQAVTTVSLIREYQHNTSSLIRQNTDVEEMECR